MNRPLPTGYFNVFGIIPGKTELGPDVSWEVVGVIGDEKIGGPADGRSAGVYVSNEQSPV